MSDLQIGGMFMMAILAAQAAAFCAIFLFRHGALGATLSGLAVATPIVAYTYWVMP